MAWQIDPATGDYVTSQGAPVNTSSLTNPAYIRLKTKRNQWLYAPDSTYGSDFYLIKKRPSVNNNSALETIAAKALQPMVNDGRASKISVTTTVTSRHAVGMEIKVLDARGNALPTISFDKITL